MSQYIPGVSGARREMRSANTSLRTDEDEVVEITGLGSPHREYMLIGLDAAEANARAAYVRGHIEIDEFEAEIERLLRKRADMRKRIP